MCSRIMRLMVVMLCVKASVCSSDIDDPQVIATAIRRIIEDQTKIYNHKMEEQQQRSQQRFQAIEDRLKRQEKLLHKLKGDVATLKSELESCTKDTSLDHKSIGNIQYEGSASNDIEESSTGNEDILGQPTENSADATEPVVEGKHKRMLRSRSKVGLLKNMLCFLGSK